MTRRILVFRSIVGAPSQSFMRFRIRLPFPPRKAAQALHDQLVEYLSTGALEVGSPFFSDAQLMKISGLSRKAVRKAMNALHSEGWIVRKIGVGTFVGSQGPLAKAAVTAHSRRIEPATGTVRLAFLSYEIREAQDNWYSRGVLGGIEKEARRDGILIEFLGNHAADIAVLSERLIQSRPNAVAVVPSTIRHVMLIAEVKRLQIPCITTGTRLLDLDLPSAFEDGAQGASIAVRHFVEQGHRRIGLLLNQDCAPWVFDRRGGYFKGLAENGLELDERLVLWLGRAGDAMNERLVLDYLARYRPSALLLSSARHVPTLGRLMNAGKVRIPNDLSIISFDQAYHQYQMHLGMRPTTIELPLGEMGARVVQIARRPVDNGNGNCRICLPCTLVEGQSVKRWEAV